ncbi:mechanosensitive ion channel [Gottschalkiaceae bacterium SANA]|nr:mechanosensitive ion channel [Gottschalkiaceae bacterium SANA]
MNWNSPVALRLIYTGIAFFLMLLIRWGLNRLIYRRIEEAERHYRVKKTTNYVLFFLFLIILVFLWSDQMGSLSTFLGLLSAGLAIALRDFLVNLFSWFFIITRRPFEVGDRIEIAGVSGDVIDLRIFEFTVLETSPKEYAEQSTGRVVHVPNSKIITEPLTNATKGFGYIWNEVGVLLTFESDWEMAKARFQSIIDEQNIKIAKAAEDSLRKASKRYFMYYSNLTPIVYTSVENSGVLLTFRFLCEPRQKRGETEKLWEAILQVIAKEDHLELAYPTSRVLRTENS